MAQVLSSMEIEIYYQLVQSNGDAYKRSSINAVNLKPNANIIHLRRAVKSENSNKLAHIDADQLTVYAAKADLDNKHPIKMMSTPVKDLGKDEDNAVFVVVPDDSQQGTDLQPPPGKNNFFTKF